MESQNKEEFPLGLDFFSLFVHELKSPLISLKFQLDDLKTRAQSAETQKKINNLQVDIHRLFQFIEDGMNMKQLENPFELKKEWTLWSDIVNKSTRNLEGWIDHKELNIQYEESIPLEAYVDSHWIQVVITNLILNAIQHSPQKSSLWLQTKLKPDNSLWFFVKDEGPGVDEKLKDKLFCRFQTSRLITTSYTKGTGLGLYIARSVAENHGGEIGMNSSQRSGCAFYLRLPKVQKASLKQAS